VIGIPKLGGAERLPVVSLALPPVVSPALPPSPARKDANRARMDQFDKGNQSGSSTAPPADQLCDQQQQLKILPPDHHSLTGLLILGDAPAADRQSTNSPRLPALPRLRNQSRAIGGRMGGIFNVRLATDDLGD
jgi:hypothetical protein